MATRARELRKEGYRNWNSESYEEKKRKKQRKITDWITKW